MGPPQQLQYDFAPPDLENAGKTPKHPDSKEQKDTNII
jgi:hypothetical protein